MKRIMIGWNDDGDWHTVLTVEGGTIVRIEPPKASGHHGEHKPDLVKTPTAAEVKLYAGDHIANGLSKLGVKPCRGCNKRKKDANAVHKWFLEQGKKVFRRA